MARYAHILFTRVDEQTKQQIALAAVDLGLSEAAFVREAIAQALSEYQKFAGEPAAQAQAGRAPVVGGETLPISTESAIAEGLM